MPGCIPSAGLMAPAVPARRREVRHVSQGQIRSHGAGEVRHSQVMSHESDTIRGEIIWVSHGLDEVKRLQKETTREIRTIH